MAGVLQVGPLLGNHLHPRLLQLVLLRRDVVATGLFQVGVRGKLFDHGVRLSVFTYLPDSLS